METPIELFDFMHESYKRTPKEKLLEWMATAADIAGQAVLLHMVLKTSRPRPSLNPHVALSLP